MDVFFYWWPTAQIFLLNFKSSSLSIAKLIYKTRICIFSLSVERIYIHIYSYIHRYISNTILKNIFGHYFCNDHQNRVFHISPHLSTLPICSHIIKLMYMSGITSRETKTNFVQFFVCTIQLLWEKRCADKSITMAVSNMYLWCTIWPSELHLGTPHNGTHFVNLFHNLY